MMDAAVRARRRILLSSYACSPLWGSEPGVGWQWLLQLARGHDVVLVTHAYFRSHLEPALADAGVRNVEVQYFQPATFGLHPHRQLNSRLYYVWWQWRVRHLVRRLLAERQFDVIHHLTWGTLRFPCLLGGLGVPLVMGPLGGGEAAPLRLFSGLPFRVRAFDYVRSLTLLWVRFDPLATWGPRRAALVLCKSDESLRALPSSVQGRAVVASEIGSSACDFIRPATVPDDAPGRQGRRFRLLFAGRLLGWKGSALAVHAMLHLRRAGRNVELSIAGDGPLREHLAQLVQAHGLQDHVRLLGAIPRDELMALYGSSDLFVFPSLHDSSGNVVLEALSRGLPVVCLDLGGPKNHIDKSCGIVVSTAGRSRSEVEQALADAIGLLLDDPERLASLSAQAAVHARRQSWEHTVDRVYQVIAKRLQWAGA